MMVTGLALAGLSVAGFYMIYNKLPGRIRRFMAKNALLTDAVACILTYYLFGGTVVALFASAFMGILISIMLWIVNNPTANALLEIFIEKIKEYVGVFSQWAKEVVNSHIEIVEVSQTAETKC